jgi:hypothetical protein
MWQEKGRRADRLADRQMKVLFSIVGLILLALILYYTLRAKVFLAPDHVQNAVGSDHISIPIEWQSSAREARVDPRQSFGA